MSTRIPSQLIENFGSIEFLAKQVVEGFITGMHKSPYHGFSVEFAEHRIYNPGESIRHIDWKLYARTEKLFTKRYEEETNLRCQLIIDSSSSMFFPVQEKLSLASPNKLLFSVYAAAALMQLLKRQRDAVGLSIFDEKLHTHTPTKTTNTHHQILYQELEQLLVAFQADQLKGSFTIDALHEIAEKIHQRSLVILFSDMFDRSGKEMDELFAALQHLRYNKHEVIVFHVSDRAKEIDFEFESRPYRFIDLESGEELKLNPMDIQKDYQQELTKFEAALKSKCAQYHIDFIEADINKGYEQILMPYLLKRQKLY